MASEPTSASPAPSSGNPQPWQERFADVVMLAVVAVAGGVLVWALASGAALPPLAYALLLGGVVLIAGLFRYAGWLKLVGPLLFYDMLRSARRGRHVWTRGVYAGLLLFLLFVAFVGSRQGGGQVSAAQKEAELARQYFEMFMSVQLVAVLVLTPAYVAGSVAEEKDRKTLEYLLATDLRNREIILSKLLSRLANLLLFVLTGLPILSILQFLGGVDPNLVLAGFAATGLTMLGLGGLSVFASIHFKKPRDAIAAAYLFVLAYYAVSFLAFAAKHEPGLRAVVSGFADILSSGNLLLMLGQVSEAGRAGKLDTVVPRLLRDYALFMGAVGALCTVLAVVRLRRVALRQGQGKSKAARARGAPRRPPVGGRPMLWKEVFAEGGIRFNWMTWVVVAVLLVATFLPAALILIYHLTHFYQPANNWESTLPGKINLWVRASTTVVCCLSLLAVAVRASTAYSGERDRQTLDSLLTTPLDSTPMLFAKWLGAILSVRLTWIWLALIWGVGLATGGLHWLAVPLLVLAWFVFAAFEATIGLWFSLLSRTSLRATVWTLLTTVGVGMGHWLPWTCCMVMPMLTRDLEYVAKVQAGLTPPAALFALGFYGGEVASHDRGWLEMIGFSLFGVFSWAVATVLLWSGLTLRFRALTLREEFLRPERGWGIRRPRPVVLEAVPEPGPPPVVTPAEEPRPTTRLSGAKLVDETWEKPRQEPPAS